MARGWRREWVESEALAGCLVMPHLSNHPIGIIITIVIIVIIIIVIVVVISVVIISVVIISVIIIVINAAW